MPSTPVPGVLARMADLIGGTRADGGGILWRLARQGRQLDANVVRLEPDARIAGHVEQDLDVLLSVAAGGGALETEEGPQELEPGCVVWLPRGARRALAAGPDGLVYLTVHRRRPGMTVRSAPPDAGNAGSAGDAEGGEAACLLHRVCPGCGRLAQEADARYCARCGERLPS